MSEKPNPRPDVLVGRKLPANSLWEQLQRRAQPLALEFCSAFFNNEMSYKDAAKWLAGYGIKVSQTALQGFFNSMDMRLRFAALQAAQSAETAKAELPADIESATRERIAQHKFELAYMNLSEEHRLQLIALQQNEDGMKGNFALKKEKLTLDRLKLAMQSDAYLEKLLKRASELVADSKLTQSDRIAAMRQEFFKDVDEYAAKVQVPKT